MSDAIYDDVIRAEDMKRDRVEMTVDIYESADSVRDHDFTTKTNKPPQTKKAPPHQQTGSDSVKIRSSRTAVVCLVLLCVLLLTAVIVLCVHIYNKSTHCTKLTEERNGIINQLSNLGKLLKEDEWIYYQFSFYYKSNEKKNWTESRRDCLKKGADLIIINNGTEQDFVMNITNRTEFWIGATDTDVEGSWKWVDGSNMTSGFRFWATGGEVNEPGGGKEENCAVSHSIQWPNIKGCHDVKCNDAYHWICEKSIIPLIQRETS
ncbi:hepatic lectin isoform X5 [Carassius gibelio]|uniref:hepatic lectin isoform X5 n=1 Tax=Carassius gibelio TaxID=101364 RepID=UPI002278DAB1|nr:hepatic lectin isoform X5 [Carassius gibelio]